MDWEVFASGQKVSSGVLLQNCKCLLCSLDELLCDKGVTKFKQDIWPAGAKINVECMDWVRCVFWHG